jgi:hypothetical protein
MSFLPDELKPQSIKCPECKQYISSEKKVCNFCSAEIKKEYKKLALEGEKKEKKAISLNSHKSYIILGVVFCLIGVGLIFQSLITNGFNDVAFFNCLTPIFIIGGIVILIKGLTGYYKEKRNN